MSTSDYKINDTLNRELECERGNYRHELDQSILHGQSFQNRLLSLKQTLVKKYVALR